MSSEPGRARSLAGFGIALVFSFLVYAAPLVGPHAAVLTGEYVARLASGRRPGLGLALGIVLLAQVASFALGMLLRNVRFALRAVALAAGWCAVTVALNVALLVLVPAATLIEADPRPDVGPLPEHCVIPGYDMPHPPTREQAEAGEVLLRPTAGGPLSLLRVPSCRPEPTSIPSNVSQLSALPGGRALFAVWRPSQQRAEWFLVPGGGQPARPVTLDEAVASRGIPLLLPDARHVGWIEPRLTERGSAVNEPPHARLAIQDLETGAVRRSPIAGVERGTWRLVYAVAAQGPFVIACEAPRRFVVIDAEGNKVDALVPQPGPEHDRELSHVALVAGGWVGWDVYAEERRYVVAWDLSGGQGRVEEPRGRGITACAADPAGRFVAYSTTTNLNVGSVPDAVTLLRARDGVPLFRRTLPRYARADVAILAASYFAWTDNSEAPGRVRVHRLPPP